MAIDVKKMDTSTIAENFNILKADILKIRLLCDFFTSLGGTRLSLHRFSLHISSIRRYASLAELRRYISTDWVLVYNWSECKFEIERKPITWRTPGRLTLFLIASSTRRNIYIIVTQLIMSFVCDGRRISSFWVSSLSGHSPLRRYLLASMIDSEVLSATHTAIFQSADRRFDLFSIITRLDSLL